MENVITQISASLYDQLIDHIEGKLKKGSARSNELAVLQQKAFQQFKRMGFPSTKVEDWKYTNLKRFLNEEFSIEDNDESTLTKDIIKQLQIPLLNCYTIVLLNGKYVPEFSDIVSDKGVNVLPINEAVEKPLFKKHFGKYVDIQSNHFEALNTALLQDGLYIEVKNKTIVDKPIHILHISSSEKNLFIQPRFLFVVDPQAEASIIESYVSTENSATVFANTVSEIVVAENAKLQHYYIQTGNKNARSINHTEVYQEASSLYNNYKASFPGIDLLRNNINVVLDGMNVESHLFGLYLSGGQQLVDNHTIVDHRQPNCFSNELYKGVMQDEAKGVFNGKVFVRKHAQKTNAFQQNNNLMLSKKATVDSKPQLEIFADDVKCSHGSTIGQFNDEALFYLRSRGIGDKKAKALLVQAFAFDVTEKFPIAEIRSHINHLIEAGLKEV